jgi:hydroxymethylpyrimidine pyrophosphatase-like HAD family hydrolase
VSHGTIDVVVSDLDGTLWHLDHDLHHRTADAIAELERRGIPLLVATGRRLRNVAVPLARFGLAPPAVVLNGALGVDLATDERFHVLAIPRPAAEGVLAAFRGAGLEPCVYVDGPGTEVYLSHEPSTHPGHIESLGTYARADDLDRVVAEEVVLGFSVIGRPEAELLPVLEALGDAGIGHLTRALDYGDASITVTGPGMSKWEGVVAYCAWAGLDPGRVLAIGDAMNDIELLQGAAVAVVPADGDPLVLEIAHHTVGPAIDGGWADLLDILDALGA